MATVMATVNCCNCQHSKTKFQKATVNFQLSSVKFQLTTNQLHFLLKLLNYFSLLLSGTETLLTLATLWATTLPDRSNSQRTASASVTHCQVTKVGNGGGLLFFAKITGGVGGGMFFFAQQTDFCSFPGIIFALGSFYKMPLKCFE